MSWFLGIKCFGISGQQQDFTEISNSPEITA
jgi:hypothetical protein